jgi:ribosomal protein S27E
MKINCLGCGHSFELDEAYEEYAGQIRCWVCGVTLEVQIEAGRPKLVKLARPRDDQAGVSGGEEGGEARAESYA